MQVGGKAPTEMARDIRPHVRRPVHPLRNIGDIGAHAVSVDGVVVAAAVPDIWATTWFPTAYLVLSPGLIAVGSVAFLSMAMRISWTQAVGTVFTTYMALSNVSSVLGKRMVGTLYQEFGYYQSFYAAASMALVPLFLLVLVSPGQVDDAKKKLATTSADPELLGPETDDAAATEEANRLEQRVQEDLEEKE